MDKRYRQSISRPIKATRRGELFSRTHQRASTRVWVLIAVSFLLGAAVSALWVYRASQGGARGGAETSQAPVGALSRTTLEVLSRLENTVEVRFYALLAPGSVPDSTREFVNRVDQLLSEFEQHANGRIKLTRHKTLSDASSDAASKDGIRPFNLDKGDACFLGITVARQEQRESLAQLSHDWEPALEFDLARVVERVATSRTTSPAPAVPAFDAAATEAVRRALPNLANVSLEEGKRILRQRAVSEFSDVAREMESQVKQAQQRLRDVQRDGSEAEQQAAMKQLQQLQADQAEKLKGIAARSQAQIAALEALKRE